MIVLASRRRQRRLPLAPSLQLTPLIDVLIVVLFYLLMSFEPTGEIFCGCGDRLRLPFADHADRLDRAPVVAMHPPVETDGMIAIDGVVTLDGSEVSTLRELVEDDSPDWKIARLTEQLEVQKHNWKLTNPDQPFPGELIIQADRGIEFKAIKKVIYSGGLAGYHSYHLVALLPGRPGSAAEAEARADRGERTELYSR